MSTVLQSPQNAAAWLSARVSGALSTNSRSIGVGDGFIAWPGAVRDGRVFVADALAAGAAACVVEAAGAEVFDFQDDRVAVYPGLKAAAGPIAAAYFGSPSEQLKLIAVTGTNGKTSTTWWLAQALGKVGLRCGVVGTLGIGEPGAMVFNGLTTPDPVLLQQQFRQFLDGGFAACAVEASSIGLAEARLDATHVTVAMFTNFTQDHLDYHGTTQAYWEAKKRLFGWPSLESAVLNIDDPKGAELAIDLGRNSLDIWTISTHQAARLQARQIEQTAHTLTFEVLEGSVQHKVRIGTAGLYNVYNLLGVVAAMRALGVPLQRACEACEGLKSVPGRLDIAPGDASAPLVIVDYAHTPDALEKVLQALIPVARGRNGRLWCVFGCGGDRDAAKRPLMGTVAQTHADQVVVTSDNPRSEDPNAIISHILKGTSADDAIAVQVDRGSAIDDTVARAQAADVVLIAGKGHEDYQEIAGIQHAFSDRQRAGAALAARSRPLQSQGAAA